MTAQEIIDKLSQYPLEQEVWIEVVTDKGSYDYIDTDIDTVTDVCIDYKTGLLKIT